MSDQKNATKELVRGWEEELRAGIEFRKKHSDIEHWDEYKSMYKCDWADDILPVNHTFSFARSIIPRTYFRDPFISAQPTQPGKTMHARVVARLLNKLIYDLKLKYTLKRSILKAIPCGISGIKLGYDSQFGYTPEQDIEKGETATQHSTRDGYKVEYNENIKAGYPWAMVEDASNIIVPFGAVDASNLAWVAHRIYRPLEDVQADQKYDKKAAMGLSGGYKFKPDSDVPGWLRGEDRTKSYCELFEIRDAKRGRIVTICEGDVLMDQPDALQIDGLPWEFVSFNDDIDTFWSIPDIKVMAPQQKEANEIRTQQSKHRRLAVIKFLYKKGALTQDALDKLLDESVYPGVEVDSEESLEGIIKILQPHIPPELSREMQETMGDMRESIGFNRNMAGEYANGTPPSAQEAFQVNQGSGIRTDERKDVMADVFMNISRKWLQYIFKFWTEDRVIDVVGPDGAMHWVKYTGDQLKGEYALKINPESGQPLTRQQRMQAADQLFGRLGGSPYADQVALHELYIGQFDWIDPNWPIVLKGQPQGQLVPGAGAPQGNPKAAGAANANIQQ